MSNNEAGWTKFWLNERDAFVRIMQLATSVFARRFLKEFGPIHGKSVLDYGCGPGLLADAMGGTGTVITGADINAYFLAAYKRKHPLAELIQLSAQIDVNENRILRAFGDTKFDFIILLSVTQYLQNQNELRDTLSLLTKVLHRKGQIIVADVVPPNHSAVQDGLSLLAECIRRNRLVDMVRFLFYLFSSAYRKHSNSTPLLELSEKQVAEIATSLNLSCKQVPKLTLHTTRLNFVLTPC